MGYTYTEIFPSHFLNLGLLLFHYSLDAQIIFPIKIKWEKGVFLLDTTSVLRLSN